ncbi:glycoside hydrolase family protein [Maribacter sp. 2307ULW6-5]
MLGQEKAEDLRFDNRLEPITKDHIFYDSDFFHWGGSIIRDADGTYHLFYSRWRMDFSAWLTHSEIARAVSDDPSGPWEYQETVLKGRGAGHWDAITAHNPKIKFFNGTYYLYYISTNPGHLNFTEEDLEATQGKSLEESPLRKLLRENQRSGVAISKSLNGPWHRLEKPIVEPSGPIETLAVNPAIAQGSDNRFYLIVKGDKPQVEGFVRNQAIAISGAPEGPFAVQPRAVMDKRDTEDMSLWFDEQRNRFYAIYHAHEFIGLLTSKRGVVWKNAEHAVVLNNTIMMKDGSILSPDRMERPFVYLEDGQPKTLCLAVKSGNSAFTVFLPIKQK